MKANPESEPSRKLVKIYRNQAETLFEQYGNNFDQFTEGLGVLTEEGDSLLLQGKATGYNILLSKEDMDLASGESLIFYSNYIGKPGHFGELIAELVDGDIIAERKIRLGKRASKTIYSGKWKVDPEHEKLGWVEGKDQTGKIRKKRESKTVETVVIFSTESDHQAKQIVEKIYIKVEWTYPDIRATISLRNALSEQKFEEVIANILVQDAAQMIALDISESFRKPYIPEPSLANRELVTFIVSPASTSG